MKKVLIANRGEIASRIIASCKKQNIETVTIYSDADQSLSYVKESDYSYRIGDPPVNKSYLQAEQIIELALREGVDAIHPGYGFLSENASFAKMVEEANLIFIGPDSKTIALMGDKLEARKMMEKANLPVLPGTNKKISSFADAASLAEEIGYPVMLKASGGGGGIGMKKCVDEQQLKNAYHSIKEKAKVYFRSEDLLVEKFIENARHVEVQILADHYGQVVHLYDRDCSTQRRNQKVIEEAPSFLNDEERTKICEAALIAAQHVNYVNAGTVEFIVDQNSQFYFLEMNTRLQVEHRVTEAITKIDIVDWQLRIAKGDKLPHQFNELHYNGHAMEFRLYAEDPNSFIPSPGFIHTFSIPTSEGLIIDQTYKPNDQVTPFYDPLVAKLTIHGSTRREVIQKANEILHSTVVEGIQTNKPILLSMLNDSVFLSNEHYTTYLEDKAIKKARR
ncbi:biotin carboxylase N-terminal domain-containing protein [Bacillus carboniphilus]|uniref:biotin carboxylase n=1 Tax=Bacillus carboniphilus TaxID=86663 RepID=A0ABY9JZ74_9BACI|nr:biotin carboxylase N-terminal domain-containing protein [Bacillus carboniphilus]WLR43638.1 biotin carboxylase N-terminal domain-containing protein [Bacillus carboniphilus]